MKVFLIVIGILIGLLALVFISVVIFLLKFVNSVNKPQYMDEIIKGEGDKKCLVIYHDSPHHSVKKIVNKAVDKLVGMGYEVTINHPNKDSKYDVNKYDLFLFGSPTYFSKPSKELSNFMLEHLISDKKIILFTSGLVLNDEKDLDVLEFFTDYSDIVLRCKCYKEDPNKLLDLIDKINDKGLKNRGYYKYFEEKAKYESRNQNAKSKRK